MTEETKKDDGIVVVTTASGKAIGIKRPHVLAQYKLVDAIGDSAENRVYLNMCIPLMWVASIDGNPVPQPTTKLQIEGLISRLDEEGITAVSRGIDEHFSRKNEVAAAKK
ncbi:MAG: hypothetical protein P4L91_06875 [Burkholderiaceae bacterium]|nr:hypothetical protein [Burkholderiaceae bacterium]